jgi:hypothetical protein
MRQWRIQNDQILDLGEVPYLGLPKNVAEDNKNHFWNKDYDGWFPFMRFCYSLGDLGIVSGLFEALKTKHPNIKIAFPSNDYIKHILGPQINQWNYETKTNVFSNIDAVFRNNPFIDALFDTGTFTTVYTDHDRSYSSLVHDGTMVRSCDEPLVEQILRMFGFSDEELATIDSKPKLYFSQQEEDATNQILKQTVGSQEYGALLFASRLDWAKGRWEKDYLLFEAAEKFKGMPVFYFSEFDLQGTEWDKYFPERYNFADLQLDVRQQIHIKRKAKFNISYQAGITDASNGSGSEMHVLCPYPTIRENCVRGARYYYFDGSKKQF